MVNKVDHKDWYTVGWYNEYATDTWTALLKHAVAKWRHRLRIRILRILEVLKIDNFFPNFKMPTNFKNKIRSADIIYEIYPAGITLSIFIIIYYYYYLLFIVIIYYLLNNIVSIL